jgi:DNA ligase (NAD+)
MNAAQFLTSLQKIDITKLLQIKGLGPNLIQNLNDFVNSARFEYLLDSFENQQHIGNNIEITSAKAVVDTESKNKFYDQKICITGTFGIPRNEIKEKLESLGVKIVNSVSSKTDYLLAGENAGSKLSEAAKFGVKIITELDEILGGM